QPAIVEAHSVQNVRALHRVADRGGLGVRDCEGLLADHSLARGGRRGGNLGVRARRRTYVDDVHVRPPDELAPVCDPGLDAVCGGGGRNPGCVAAADHADLRAVGKLPHQGRDGVSVGMGLAHHSVPDDADPDLRSAHVGDITWAAARWAASRAAAASLALAPSRGAPCTCRAKLSAWRRSAPKNVSSAVGGHRNLHSSAPLVPKTSTLHTSPRGKRRPSETNAVVPPDSSAIACALSGSPGQGSSATPEASDAIGPNSWPTSHRV